MTSVKLVVMVTQLLAWGAKNVIATSMEMMIWVLVIGKLVSVFVKTTRKETVARHVRKATMENLETETCAFTVVCRVECSEVRAMENKD